MSYFVVLRLTSGASPGEDAFAAGANAGSLALPAAAAWVILRRHVQTLPPARKLVWHLGLSAAFAGLWYWLLMVVMGAVVSGSVSQFTVRPRFPGSAVAWQLLQGLTVYGLIAALAELSARRAVSPGDRGSAADLSPPTASPQPLARRLVRVGEEIKSIEVDEIVTITGAGDYVEMSTTSGRHLARMSLAEFEMSLPAERFLRVHRSAIVNLERLEKAEPAGSGRLLLHMQTGERVQTSRAGARTLRALVV